MRAIDLFSGIGGFALAGRMVWGNGYQVVSFCEIDPFCQKILNRHWPGVPVHGNAETFRGEDYAGTIDILTGGEPCQPHSQAGKRKGKKDHRYLWPVMFRIAEEIRPRWIVNENVVGSVSNGIVDQKCDDLERIGYTCQPFNLPAVAVGAWHRRERIWIVGHTDSRDGKQWEIGGDAKDTNAKPSGVNGVAANSSSTGRRPPGSTGKAILEPGTVERSAGCSGSIITHPNGAGFPQRESIRSDTRKEQQATIGNFWEDHWLEAATRFCAISDGIPRMVVRRRRKKIKALGNAIVPQVAAVIMQAIKENDEISK